jgi:diguanylate cyclase (GGDEF)-like protein
VLAGVLPDVVRAPKETCVETPVRGRSSHRPPFRASVALLLVALAALVALTTVMVASASQIQDITMRQRQIAAELPMLGELVTNLAVAEAGQRGFQLTGDAQYLEPFQRSVGDLEQEVVRLTRMHQLGDPSWEELARLHQLVRLKLAELSELVESQRRGRGDEVVNALRDGHGLRLTRELHSLVNARTARLDSERAALATELLARAAQQKRLALAQLALVIIFVTLAMGQLRLAWGQNVRLLARLSREATHDGLTGLPNRRYFLELMDHEFAVALRRREPLSVLLIDLDGFKAVNDHHGHQAGDALLREVSAALGVALRRSDFLCRLGGDEFAVLARGKAPDGELDRLAHRLLDAVRNCAARQGYDVGASIGIASWPDDAADMHALIGAADHAMYEAKHAGKGRAQRARRSDRLSPAAEAQQDFGADEPEPPAPGRTSDAQDSGDGAADSGHAASGGEKNEPAQLRG